MGAPGAGKGTHAKEISARYKIPHISTGDILRDEVQKNSPLGRTAKMYMDSGKLLPDEIILEIIRNRFKEEDCKNGYLLDGFPRTLNQAQKLEEISPTQAAIYLRCNDELLIKRLTGRRMGEDGRIYNIYFDPPPAGVSVIQRNDDREETIRERLRVFYETFIPLMDFYRDKGLLYEIRGDEEREKVFKEIIGVLEKIK